MDDFIKTIDKESENIDINDNAYESIRKTYERVLIETLIATFGLDYIKDKKGGDVDTIYNVRNEIDYKNSRNKKVYEKIGDYDTKAYHSDSRFSEIKRNARSDFDKNGTLLDDRYVPGNTLIPRNNNTIDRNRQGQLDHIIPAEKIHTDKGRVLSGVNGVDLASSKDNLAFTNANLNRNKSNMTVEEYIEWAENNPDKVNWNGNKGEPLPEEVKQKLRQEYNSAQAKYDQVIYKSYYTSKEFWTDTALASGKVGVQMGIRQVLGFIFAEVWFVTKEEMELLPSGCELKEIIETIGKGVEKGFKSAIQKYDKMIERFGEGFLAGALASLSTTICNIFFTTSKQLVNNIRQIYASVVRATNVLLINPDDLDLGDRFKMTAVILATGASVLAGTYVGTKLAEIGLAGIPVVGSMIVRFCSSLISGLLSCSFLLFMDRSKFINMLVDRLNQIPTEVTDMKKIIDSLNMYSAELAQIDLEQFESDTKQYLLTAELICKAKNEKELEKALESTYKHFGFAIPWKNDFDDFMSNRNNQLVFK